MPSEFRVEVTGAKDGPKEKGGAKPKEVKGELVTVEAFNYAIKISSEEMTALRTSLTIQFKEVESKIGSTLAKFEEKFSNHDVLF